MTKLNLTNLGSLQNESTALTQLQSNNVATIAALENTLSRDGTGPNMMLADYDMNSHRILNLPDAADDQEPSTFGQLKAYADAVGSGAVIQGSYVTVNPESLLANERSLTAGTNMGLTDTGPGGEIIVSITDPELDALAALSSAADQVPYFTGAGTATTATLTSYARTLIADPDATTARATLILDQVDNTSDATKNAATATLTNKTLTSPVINTPTINGGTQASPSITTPTINFGTGATSSIEAGSTNNGHTNQFVIGNGGTVSNASTSSIVYANLDALSNGYMSMSVGGGATPTAQLQSGSAISGGLNISALAGPLNITNPQLSTPALGTPSSGTMTNVTGLPLTTGVTGVLPVANGGSGVGTSTGTGSVVLSTSPTITSPSLVTPALGTPASGVMTNVTGTAASLTAGHVTTNANLTGPITSTGNATTVAAQTGTGSTFVMQTSPTINSPTLTTPALGTPASGVLTSATGLPLTTGVTGTLPVLNGGTGTTTSTGTGNTVLSTSPILVTPALGTPSSATLTNATGLPLSGLTAEAAFTIVGNNTSGSAVPTAISIASLTTKASPVSGDIVLIQDSAASNAFKQTTVGALSSAGAVASIGGATGAITLGSDLSISGTTLSGDTTLIGEVKWFPFTRVPNSNYHLADGTAISRTTYATLLSHLIHTSTVTFTNASANIGWTAHGLSAGDPVKFYTTGGLPTGFTAGTAGTGGTFYYVISTGLTTNTFEVSATPGGTAITAGSAGTGTQTAVNTPWGDGDNSTTFNLPDLRGEFIRSWDAGRGVDTNRGFGADQLDAMQGHLHGTAQSYATFGSGSAAASFVNAAGTTLNQSSIGGPISDGTNGTPRTATETRPRNQTICAFVRIL